MGRHLPATSSLLELSRRSGSLTIGIHACSSTHRNQELGADGMGCCPHLLINVENICGNDARVWPGTECQGKLVSTRKARQAERDQAFLPFPTHLHLLEFKLLQMVVLRVLAHRAASAGRHGGSATLHHHRQPNKQRSGQCRSAADTATGGITWRKA